MWKRVLVKQTKKMQKETTAMNKNSSSRDGKVHWVNYILAMAFMLELVVFMPIQTSCTDSYSIFRKENSMCVPQFTIEIYNPNTIADHHINTTNTQSGSNTKNYLFKEISNLLKVFLVFANDLNNNNIQEYNGQNHIDLLFNLSSLSTKTDVPTVVDSIQYNLNFFGYCKRNSHMVTSSIANGAEHEYTDEYCTSLYKNGDNGLNFLYVGLKDLGIELANAFRYVDPMGIGDSFVSTFNSFLQKVISINSNISNGNKDASNTNGKNKPNLFPLFEKLNSTVISSLRKMVHVQNIGTSLKCGILVIYIVGFANFCTSIGVLLMKTQNGVVKNVWKMVFFSQMIRILASIYVTMITITHHYMMSNYIIKPYTASLLVSMHLSYGLWISICQIIWEIGCMFGIVVLIKSITHDAGIYNGETTS